MILVVVDVVIRICFCCPSVRSFVLDYDFFFALLSTCCSTSWWCEGRVFHSAPAHPRQWSRWCWWSSATQHNTTQDRTASSSLMGFSFWFSRCELLLVNAWLAGWLVVGSWYYTVVHSIVPPVRILITIIPGYARAFTANDHLHISARRANTIRLPP